MTIENRPTNGDFFVTIQNITPDVCKEMKKFNVFKPKALSGKKKDGASVSYTTDLEGFDCTQISALDFYFDNYGTDSDGGGIAPHSPLGGPCDGVSCGPCKRCNIHGTCEPDPTVTTYKDCGKCENGSLVLDTSVSPGECKKCGLDTSWKIENQVEGFLIGDCYKCNHGTKVPDNSRRKGCAKCVGGSLQPDSDICHTCDTATGSETLTTVGYDKVCDNQCCKTGSSCDNTGHCCPTGNTCPVNQCCNSTPHSAANGCPAYTTYTTKPCVCSTGYTKTACVSGTNYETARETLGNNSICYKCTNCPSNGTKPTNACYNTQGVTGTHGCPNYSIYPSRACQCNSNQDGSQGYVSSCGAGQYITETKTLVDGVKCYKCANCPTSGTKPATGCYDTVNHPAANGCPAYTTYTVKPCTCSSGYTKTACVSGTNYETARETLTDGTICYQCTACPTNGTVPTNKCYDTVNHPAANGCPAYTTYTVKACTCSAGYTKTACVSGINYETARQTLTDGTVCYQCTACPTNGTVPTNKCYDTVSHPAANGCPAHTTYTIKACSCSSGYTNSACVSGTNYQTATQTLADGTRCYKCTPCPKSDSRPSSGCYDTITHPVANGCPAYTTYTSKACPCTPTWNCGSWSSGNTQFGRGENQCDFYRYCTNSCTGEQKREHKYDYCNSGKKCVGRGCEGGNRPVR